MGKAKIHVTMIKNFKIAFYELFGKHTIGQSASDPMENYAGDVKEGGISEAICPEAFAPVHFDASSLQSRSMQTTIISADTMFEGKIMSEGHIQIDGTVKGDISAKGNIKITGNVEGNISGAAIDLNSCTVTGDLKADTIVTMDSGSNLNGGITSEDIVLDGPVTGNLCIGNSATLKERSCLHGNIAVSSFSSEKGAVIIGEVKVECK